MKKLFQWTLIFAVLSVIANVGLLIMWQTGKNAYKNLEDEVEQRDNLIRKFYADHLLLDKNGIDLLKSICLNDSVSPISMLPYKIEESDRRIIFNVVRRYKDKVESQDVQGYANLFADTVARFYLKDSVSSIYVYENTKKIWSTNANMIKPVYDLSSMSIDKHPQEYVIYIPFKKNNSEYITELRLNQDFKIFYIRDFFGYVDK